MKSLSLSQPHVIVMVGVPGSGKSFFAEKFADTFHAPRISRATLAALASNKSADSLLHHQLDELLKTSQSIVIDGTADTRTERADLTQKAHAAGYKVLFVWVQTDPATTKIRSTKKTKEQTSPLLTVDEYERRMKRFTSPAAIEKPLVISGKHTYATQAKVVLKKLSAPRASISTHAAAPVRATPEAPSRRNITVR